MTARFFDGAVAASCTRVYYTCILSEALSCVGNNRPAKVLLDRIQETPGVVTRLFHRPPRRVVVNLEIYFSTDRRLYVIIIIMRGYGGTIKDYASLETNVVVNTACSTRLCVAGE